jgi:hypothetical protein
MQKLKLIWIDAHERTYKDSGEVNTQAFKSVGVVTDLDQGLELS